MSTVTTLIIARHGNTFKKGELVCRIGGRTDLPLVSQEQGHKLGLYLQTNKLVPDVLFSGPLLRTLQTAMHTMQAIGRTDYTLHITEGFKEVDYGPDENQPENLVIERLGQQALIKKGVDLSQVSLETIEQAGQEVLTAWNRQCVVPEGWNISVSEVIEHWQSFGKEIEQAYTGKTILVVTSNGIARFSPCLTGDLEGFGATTNLKIATGAICIFEKKPTDLYWQNKIWNYRP